LMWLGAGAVGASDVSRPHEEACAARARWPA